LTPPVTSDGATSLRGFWLLSAAVGLAAVVLAATIARAGMQIDRIEATIDTAAQTRSARVDEALSSWGVAWLDTWLRERELLEADRAALGVCLEVYLRDLDRVSVSGNVVRFGHIEKARKGAVSCVAEVLGPHHAQDFVAQLQQRWGDFLEQRGETAPRLTEGGRRGQPGGGPGGGPGASRGGPPGGGPPGGGPGGGPGGERRGPPPKGRGPGAGGGPGR
jgi:hypothetical protein